MKNKVNIVLEIISVLAIMLVIKSIADYFEINGAGSIAIWSAIFIATIFMRRRKTTWRDLGLVLPKGKREWLTRQRGRFVNFGISYGFGKGEAMQFSGQRR